jgi:hypothetical protein
MKRKGRYSLSDLPHSSKPKHAGHRSHKTRAARPGVSGRELGGSGGFVWGGGRDGGGDGGGDVSGGGLGGVGGGA